MRSPATSSSQFIERKLDGLNIRKVVPDEETLREACRRARATRLVNDQLKAIIDKATEDAKSMTMGSNLAEQVRSLLDEDPSIAWDAAVARIEGNNEEGMIMMRRPYDRDWQRVRKRHLAQHPTCVRCGAAGVDVDHVVSVRKAPDRRLDPTNLQTLCHGCHSRITRLYDGQRKQPAGAALSGAPLDPTHPWHGQASAGEVHSADVLRWHKGRQGKR